jgi:hypothetical protein
MWVVVKKLTGTYAVVSNSAAQAEDVAYTLGINTKEYCNDMVEQLTAGQITEDLAAELLYEH